MLFRPVIFLGSCALRTTLCVRDAACPSHWNRAQCYISQLISGRIRQIYICTIKNKGPVSVDLINY